MKVLWFFGEIVFCLAVCGSLASADSMALRNGRRLQGKYVGGTTATIGFMTAVTVEYFPTSEVIALMFDNNVDFPTSGLQTSPMKKIAVPPSRAHLRLIHSLAISGPPAPHPN